MIKNTLDVAEGTPVVAFSALSKQGRDEIWDLIETYALNMDYDEADENGLTDGEEV